MATLLQRDREMRERAWAVHALPVAPSMSLAMQGPMCMCAAWTMP